MNDSEENVYARLTYNPDGIVIDKTYDYSFAMRFFDTKNNYKIEASIFFSLDQEEEREDQIFANFICATNLYYDEYSYVTCIYQNISWEYVYTGIGNIYHEDLNYGNYFYQKSNNWNNAYNYDENNWQSRGWQYVNTVFDELKEICDEAEFNIYDI